MSDLAEYLHWKDRLTQAVLRRLASELSEPNAHYDAELEYCDDMVLEAARKMVAAYE